MNKQELIENLSTLDDGIHQIWDDKNRIYQGIVKDGKVLFYTDSMGGVFQDDGLDKQLKQKFKDIGQLTAIGDFKTIAKFNKWY